MFLFVTAIYLTSLEKRIAFLDDKGGEIYHKNNGTSKYQVDSEIAVSQSIYVNNSFLSQIIDFDRTRKGI
jgi:hypothetical protein